MINGVLPISTLVLMEVALSYITLKNLKARRVIEGTPSIIIEKGRFLDKEMSRLRYNVDDMISQMREQGVSNIEDVEYAILETNGKLSIILKSSKRPLVPEDLGLQPPYEGLPLPLVSDGNLLSENLALAQKDLAWLESLLEKDHGCKIVDVIYATLDTKGKLVVYKKGEIKKTP